MNMHKQAYSLPIAGSSNAGIRSFKDLAVWQRAMDLTVEIYKLTRALPDTERYGLVSQMRRCAVSIPSNIAEGKRRGTRNDFVQFLRIADGSASELETQLLLAQKLFTVKGADTAGQLLGEVQRMLGGMLKKLSLPAASRKLPAS
jgi:four helix bundle protein